MNTQKKLEAAFKLLNADSTTRERFELIRELLKGIDTRVDQNLSFVSKRLAEVEKLQKGRIVELTIEHLPENTKEEKERKRAILLLLKTWKDLKGEVKRIQAELHLKQKGEASQSTVGGLAKIAAFAKGPFGIITIAALIIVGLVTFVGSQTTTTKGSDETYQPINQVSIPAEATPKTKAIKVGEKMIALTQLTTGQGSECMSGNVQASHYHAKDHAKAQAIDGSFVPDPGGCGFGKVDEVEVVLVE
jgi:hypothetical protein